MNSVPVNLPQDPSPTPAFGLRGFEVCNLSPDAFTRSCAYAARFGMNTMAVHLIDFEKWHLLDYRDRWSLEPVDSEAAAETLHLQERVREAIRIARDHGLDFYLFHHEIKLPIGLLEKMGPGFIDFEGEELWKFVEWKLERKFELFPGLKGIFLTATGERMPGFGVTVDSAASSGTAAERLARIFAAVQTVCDRHGKDLIIRNHGVAGTGFWDTDQGHFADFTEAAASLDGDFRLMGKCEEPDFQPSYPFNFALGKLAAIRPTLIEFSLPMEYNGVSMTPFPMVESIKFRLECAAKMGLQGTIARLDWDMSTHQVDHSFSVLGTLNEINGYAYARLSSDPGIPLEELFDGFCAERYGPGAAAAREILRDLYLAGCRKQYTFGMRIVPPHNVSGSINPPEYSAACQRGETYPMRSGDPVAYALLERSRHPDDAFITMADDEKQSAEDIYRRALAVLDRPDTGLRESDARQFRDGLQRALDELAIRRLYTRCYFHWVRFKNTAETASHDEALHLVDQIEPLARTFHDQLDPKENRYGDGACDSFGVHALKAADAMRTSLQELSDHFRAGFLPDVEVEKFKVPGTNATYRFATGPTTLWLDCERLYFATGGNGSAPTPEAWNELLYLTWGGIRYRVQEDSLAVNGLTLQPDGQTLAVHLTLGQGIDVQLQLNAASHDILLQAGTTAQAPYETYWPKGLERKLTFPFSHDREAEISDPARPAKRVIAPSAQSDRDSSKTIQPETAASRERRTVAAPREQTTRA